MAQNINSNSLINGFTQYLCSLNPEKYNLAGTEASIYMYSNEFKDYITEEYNSTSSLSSMSVNEILDMEVVNGKLIESDEQTDNYSIDTDSSENETGVYETPMVYSADASTENSNTFTELEGGTEEISVVDTLNQLFDQDSIKNIIDTDTNGELNEEEIFTFLNAIKGYDGDGENISIEDILGAIQAINDGSFSLDEDIAQEVEETVRSQKTAEAAAIYNNQTQEKTLQTMTKDELNDKLETAETDLINKQAVLTGILDGTDSEIKKLKDDYDTAYDNYYNQLKSVNTEIAAQVDELKQAIDDKEQQIDCKEQEISDQECVLSDAKATYENASAARETLESSKQALESTDTSEMSSEEKADINSKISELENKIQEAKTAEDEAKAAVEEAETQLTLLNDEKEELISGENGLNELNTQMTELEGQIVEENPQIQSYITDYNNKKETYTSTKEEAVTNAKSDIQTSQDYVNEVNSALSNYDNKQIVREYCINTLGEDIAAYAEQFLNYNEYDGSADIFLGGTSSASLAWCAAFVEYSLENSGAELPDWYQNISNKWYCQNIYNAASASNALINSDEVQVGDLVLFDWNGDGHEDHVGIVSSVNDDGTINTIEGNSSNKVQSKSYNSSDSRLSYAKIT